MDKNPETPKQNGSGFPIPVQNPSRPARKPEATAQDRRSPKPADKGSSSPADGNRSSDRKKIKGLVLQYFDRITNGCGDNPKCKNTYCKSSPAYKKPATRKAGLRLAMKLVSMKNRPKLCVKVHRKGSGDKASKEASSSSPEPLDIKTFTALLEEARGGGGGEGDEAGPASAKKKQEPDFRRIIRAIGQVFADGGVLSRSFPRTDENGKAVAPTTDDPAIDFDGLDQFYAAVEDNEKLQEVLNGACERLCQRMLYQLPKPSTQPIELRKFLIMLENRSFEDPTYQHVFRKLCQVIVKLSPGLQDVLVRWMSTFSAQRMDNLIGCIQQYITVMWITSRTVEDLKCGTIILGLVYRANEPWRPVVNHTYNRSPRMQGGLFMPPWRVATSSGAQDAKVADDAKAVSTAAGGAESSSGGGDSGVGGTDVKQRRRHVPIVKPDAFYNDALNQELKIESDYQRWVQRKSFSFCKYPYILDASSKRDVLRFDAKHQMRAQYRDAFMQRMMSGQMNRNAGFLIFTIRRTHLIADTLIQLQNAKLFNMREDEDKSNAPAHLYLKKPLKIKFKGEEGVDEGGVKKEFFHLVIKQLFDPVYGMFTYDPKTRLCWFNKTSLTPDEQFELIGVLLGLAIYNGVILDLRFPMYVYRKLMGWESTPEDLREVDPEMARGFDQLLAFKGDVESTFCRTFSVSYDVFGAKRTVELKKGGADIPLTNANREEYVRLYTKWVLEDSIARQFRAFKNGFIKVCGGPALDLFRPEELHQLICGSEKLDFDALEKATRYADGFNKNSKAVRNLWKVLASFTLEQKKRFLMFCTGSDRAPIKGLGDLSFTISKNGNDSNRLPTSHTCFNHLLLPDYATLEKLRRCLLVAIDNCKGFGLL